MSYIQTDTVITGFNTSYSGPPIDIVIGNDITRIQTGAFYGCSYLKAITFANESIITSIEPIAFEFSSLQSIVIPSRVTRIDDNIFRNCTSLASITILSDLTSIANFAFQNCSALQSITIPSSVTSIGVYAFQNCSSLQSITIPASVTSIADGAFMNCSSLQSITFESPSSVISIGEAAFAVCTSLTSITIPPSVTSIGADTFNSCTSLRAVSYWNIGNGTTVGGGAFDNCHPNIVITVYPTTVKCFPPGTLIATGTGYRAVETLKTGDLVLTADNRQVPIKAYSFTITTTADTAPYKIPKNSLGPSMPAADLHLSPLHAFQLKKGLWHIPKYAAKQYSAIQQYDVGKKIPYYHFECPNFFTDNLIADGCIVESYAGKQLVEMKTIYTYNKKLHGCTRANASAHNVRLSN